MELIDSIRSTYEISQSQIKLIKYFVMQPENVLFNLLDYCPLFQLLIQIQVLKENRSFWGGMIFHTLRKILKFQVVSGRLLCFTAVHTFLLLVGSCFYMYTFSSNIFAILSQYLNFFFCLEAFI